MNTGLKYPCPTGDQIATCDNFEGRIREKVFGSGILTSGEWVYLVGTFQAARDHHHGDQ